MRMICLDTVDSTNAAAQRLLAWGGIAGPAVILANEQTAGRGTRGRAWASPPGAGIYLSIVDPCTARVTPDTAIHTLAAGVGCAEAIRASAGVDVRVKPVNDLVANGGKLGGILTEALIESGRLVALITGIGINTRRAHRPVESAPRPPISLEDLMTLDRFAALRQDELIDALVASVLKWQQFVTDGCVDAVREAAKEWGAGLSGEDAAELPLDVRRGQ